MNWSEAINALSLVDVGCVALGIWTCLSLLNSARSALAVSGLGLLSVAYVLAKSAGLVLTSWGLLLSLGVGGLFVIILFQDDVRTSLNRIAALLFARRRPLPAAAEARDVLVEAVDQLAERRSGALLVLPGKQALDAEVHGGIGLDARLSIPLLISLFDAATPGHDGAVIVMGGRAKSFAVHLPLSQREDLLGGRGTRHAAALGLSERSDALCIVVSEERGDISVTRRGQLSQVDAAGLRVALQEHGAGRPSLRSSASLSTPWAVHLGRGALALGLSALFWALAVPGATVATRAYTVPITIENLPDGLALSGDPSQITVEVSGPQRVLMLTSEQDIKPAVDAAESREGKRRYVLTRKAVEVPNELEVKRVSPTTVVLTLQREPS